VPPDAADMLTSDARLVVELSVALLVFRGFFDDLSNADISTTTTVTQ